MAAPTSASLLLLAALLAATGHGYALEAGSRRGLLQDDSAVPNECVGTGLDLQTSCTAEIELATKAFGLDPTADISDIKVSNKEVAAYLAKAPPPTLGCCAATVGFNNAYCSCSPAVLDLIKSFTNNDIGQYRVVAKYLESRCKGLGKPFKLYMDATCPKAPKAPMAKKAP